MTQRPKLTYNIFDGTQNNWSTFRKNQEQIFEYFSDNPVQQLHQLSKICSPQIAATILSFNTPEKALDWLILKYGVPHLQLPQVYKEFKSLPRAKNKYEIPQTAEAVLAKLESLANLIQSEDQALPGDVITFNFQCLNLTTEEQKLVLPMIAAPEGVSIKQMKHGGPVSDF